MYKVLTGTWNIEEEINKQDLLILQYGTKTCNPCHALSKKLEDWSKEYPNVKVIYIPIENYLEQSHQMGILSAPTIHTYIKGQLFQKESGYFSLDQLLERYETLIKTY